MFCKGCGKEVIDTAEICPSCGTRVASPVSSQEDTPNMLVNIASLCCIPLLGIVLYFVWKDTKPKSAKSALTYSLVSIGIGIIGYILVVAVAAASH